MASAANVAEASVKLRSGYWNGSNNVKSSFSCNNLSDLEQPGVILEKLRSLPVPTPAVSTNGGNKSGTTTTTAAPTLSHGSSRKSDSFQRTSSETEEDVADIRSQHMALKQSMKPPAHQRNTSVGLNIDRSFDDGGPRITSPRSYFEQTSSYSLGPTASPSLTSSKRSSKRDVRLWVGTWNMGAADPFEDGKGIIDEQRSATMLQNFLPHGYHLYVLGVQEGVSENVYHAVEAYLNRNEEGTRYYRMELKNSNFMVNHKNYPPDAVIDAVHGRGDGAFVGTKFTGMAVFYCARIKDKVKLIRAGVHKFKLTSGSKGGVAVALMVNQTTMVFVNCHLDARNDTYRREQIRNLNANLGRVMGHYSFDLTEQFHHVVWMGDMNYRIVLLDPQMVLHMLEEGRNLELHDKFDGLLNDRRNGGVFEGFTEPHKFPDFYPTYKKFPKRGIVNESLPLWPSLVFRVLYKEPFYKGGKVKKRVPGWCDRILIHSLLVSDSKLIPEKILDPTSKEQSPLLIDNYRSVNHGDGMDVSDHSPVFGTFVLSFPQQDTDALGASYFDQARVVRQMKAQNRPVSTVLRVFNMQLSWNDNVVVPKKTRIVAPLVGEDAKQCDVIGERCQGSNGLNLSLNAVIQHTRPLEQLHMLVWVKNDSINGHCTLSLKRIARQEEGGEVKFRVPLYNDSMRDENVHRVLSLPAHLSSNMSSTSNEAMVSKPQTNEGSMLQFERLRVSVTSLAFFDKLEEAGIVARDGSIRGCMDEDFDGCTAGDLLTEMLANPESENCEVFSDQDKQEFIFQLFFTLVIGGGALCQPDPRLQAYESTTRALYRALVSVKKSIASTNGKRDIEITSRIYRVHGDALFKAPSSRFQSCFVILDSRKRRLTVCVDCYRTHGEDCTEQFFESHVRNEMQLNSTARGGDQRQQQRSIQELLERVKQFQDEQQAPEDEDEVALTERMQELAMLDATGELTLASLTPGEKKKFLGEVADGRLGKLVELWSPWWLLSERKYRSETSTKRRQLIMEGISSNDEVKEVEDEIPQVVTVEPTVLFPVGLFGDRDAKMMPENMKALLPVLRAFNGDYDQDVAEAALMLLDLCQVLSADARYETVEHVCLVCLEKQSSEGATANPLAVQDVQQLLQTHVFILDALSDTRTLLKRYQRELEDSSDAEKKARKERKAAIKRLAIVEKKLQFYQTWAFLTPNDEFQELAAEIEAYTKEIYMLGAQ
ncbi:hypothetical protein BBJ29_002480 [Phytophthora kernoviae]|uniref:Inositol polyphosphate-related phosphatase domain-containing protein n=1 Tax=Phytophthora kernoviae TaxID=325452 RepID=A0A3R7K854_9STRA|nr:hypothetical protein BBJ29_002480 [Phytophthora kernoviae]